MFSAAAPINIDIPAAVLVVDCTPVCPCEYEGIPVDSSASCLNLSNICKFSCAVFGNFNPWIDWPGIPDCLLNILPGYTFKSWPGTNIVSSTSNTKLPAKAKLSIAILAWPFIICCESSMFSGTPTPKNWYGFNS